MESDSDRKVLPFVPREPRTLDEEVSDRERTAELARLAAQYVPTDNRELHIGFDDDE